MAIPIAELAAKVVVDGIDAAKAKVSGFVGDIDTAGDRLTAAGDKMDRAGSILSTKVTLPLVAAGGAAIKMGLDFDGSMAKIVGLVGVASDEVDQMRGSVLELAGETAKSPAELADALFTVTSAGLRGQEAMSVLEMSAKASAAGMGETRTIAEALTASLNAYRSSGLTAAAATDILVATARAGNFEASQFAGALGQVLPIASNLSIGLADVGGAVALLTRTNNNASESITQIRAVMTALSVPSAEAQTILAAVGLTMADVRATAAGPEGLVGALRMLDEATGGNVEKLGRVLGSSEAANAAFAILNASAEDIASTFGAVGDAAGTLDEAFGAMEETAGFQLKQTLVEVQTAAVELGTKLAPIAADIASAFAHIVDMFTALPEPVQNVALIGVTAAAATGPVLKLAGNVTSLAGAMTKSYTEGGLVAKLFTTGLGPAAVGLGVAAVGAGIAWSRWAEDQQRIAERAEGMTELFLAQADALDELSRSFYEQQLEAMGASEAFSIVGLSLDEMSSHVQTGTDEFGVMLERLKSLPVETQRQQAALADLTGEVLANSDSYDTWTVAIFEAIDAGRLSIDQARELFDALDELSDSADDSAGNLRDMALSLARVAQDSDLMSDAQVRLLASVIASTDNSAVLASVIDELNGIIANGVPLVDALYSSATTAGGGVEFLAGKAGIATGDMQGLTGASDDLTYSFDEQYASIEELNSAYADLLDLTSSSIESNLRAESGWITLTGKIGDHNAALADGTLQGQDLEQAVIDLTAEAWNGAEAFAGAAEKAAELAGEQFTAADKAAIMRGKLLEAASAAGEGSDLQLAILGLIGLLDDFTGDYEASLHVNAQNAIAQLGIVKALMDQINTTVIAPPATLQKPRTPTTTTTTRPSDPWGGNTSWLGQSLTLPGVAGGEQLPGYSSEFVPQGLVVDSATKSAELWADQFGSTLTNLTGGSRATDTAGVFAAIPEAGGTAGARAGTKAAEMLADTIGAETANRSGDITAKIVAVGDAVALEAGESAGIEFTNRLVTELDTEGSRAAADVFARILDTPATEAGARSATKAVEMFADQLEQSRGYTTEQGLLLMDAFTRGMADGTTNLVTEFGQGIDALRNAGQIAADDPFWASVGDDIAAGAALGFSDAWRNEAEPALLDALEVVTMWGWDVADQGGTAATAGGEALSSGLVEGLQRVWVGTGIPALDDMLRQLDAWGVYVNTDTAVQWWNAGGTAVAQLVDALATGWAADGPPSLEEIRAQLEAWGLALPETTSAYANGYETIAVMADGVAAAIDSELGAALAAGSSALHNWIGENEGAMDIVLSSLADQLDAAGGYATEVAALRAAAEADAAEAQRLLSLGWSEISGRLDTLPPDVQDLLRGIMGAAGTTNYNLNVSTNQTSTGVINDYQYMQTMSGAG